MAKREIKSVVHRLIALGIWYVYVNMGCFYTEWPDLTSIWNSLTDKGVRSEHLCGPNRGTYRLVQSLLLFIWRKE